jgi:hypothetical protein
VVLLYHCNTSDVQSLRSDRTRDRTISDYDARRCYDVEAHYSRTDVLLHTSFFGEDVFAYAVLEVASGSAECIPENLVGYRSILCIGMYKIDVYCFICYILSQSQSWLGSVFSSIFTCDNLVEKFQQGKCGSTPDEQQRIIFSLYFAYAVDITTDLASESHYSGS